MSHRDQTIENGDTRNNGKINGKFAKHGIDETDRVS